MDCGLWAARLRVAGCGLRMWAEGWLAPVDMRPSIPTSSPMQCKALSATPGWYAWEPGIGKTFIFHTQFDCDS
ncbi:hypothetical protein SAMD00023353_4300320 [Rosellinia necatrix]|uniref:Uncharacterized protein n=1 Tax=Rosellinia necatrix TaxID=77044 RepID=A0A1S8A9Q1_ROSNE|nr:hypothetical protein SAMD00023353_4300320 [Rosellinia necatrix]